MSKLVSPRDNSKQKLSRQRDSSAAVAERRLMMARLASMPEYKMLKEMAQTVANQYRNEPGRTREENESYLTHCTILWAYNTIFSQVDNIAKSATKGSKQDDNTGW